MAYLRCAVRLACVSVSGCWGGGTLRFEKIPSERMMERAA